MPRLDCYGSGKSGKSGCGKSGKGGKGSKGGRDSGTFYIVLCICLLLCGVVLLEFLVLYVMVHPIN